jgi:DNA processing protein
MREEEYNYWLSNISGIGAVKIDQLLQNYHCAEEIYRSDKKELIIKSCLKEKEIEALISSKDKDKISSSYEKLEQKGIQFIPKMDIRYPSRLKHIYGAPFALYVKGKLPGEEEKTLAMVGARECSIYGKEISKYLAGAIAKEGIAIISGLARGIDSYAHLGALNGGGSTYGILGCGIDICYPKENLPLYIDMQKEGGVISEYAPGLQPLACNFPMRNRIISGLSDGILVIEAREKSGSLITVDMGLDQGKNIYAIPGRITDSLSGGCNNLIKMGAKLVTSPQDILEDYLINFKGNIIQSNLCGSNLNKQEKIVYDTLSLIPKHLEDIVLETKLPLDELMETLVTLELRDMVNQTMRNYYVVKV